MKSFFRKILTVLAVIGLFIGGFATIRFLAQNSARHHKTMTGTMTEKGIYYCPMHPTYTSEHPGDCPICNMKLVKQETRAAGPPPPKRGKKILYWTDPMIPGYRSDKPGKSPMGMDLIPVYQEAGPMGSEGSMMPKGYAPVEIAPQKQQLIGVKTVVAKKERLTKTIRTVGRIAFDPELYQAEEEFLQALRALKSAQEGGNSDVLEQTTRLMDSSRLRLRLLGLSDSLMEEMKKWEKPDASLLLSDANGRVWLYAPVYEFELPYVKEGQTISVESPVLPGKILQGVIRSIDPVLDPMTRSARVRAVLTDPEKRLRPQMYVDATIEVPLGDVLAVPQEAVFDTGTRRILFVSKGEGLFEPREVKVGVQAGDLSEIKAGVAEGETVVTNGNFLIDSESRLKAALEGAGSTGHSHGP